VKVGLIEQVKTRAACVEKPFGCCLCNGCFCNSRNGQGMAAMVAGASTGWRSLPRLASIGGAIAAIAEFGNNDRRVDRDTRFIGDGISAIMPNYRGDRL